MIESGRGLRPSLPAARRLRLGVCEDDDDEADEIEPRPIEIDRHDSIGSD
jgi:hypothetical protein